MCHAQVSPLWGGGADLPSRLSLNSSSHSNQGQGCPRSVARVFGASQTELKGFADSAAPFELAGTGLMFNRRNDGMGAPPNEPELIERAQHGDKEAVSILYQTYAQPVFQYISYRVKSDEMAEDLTADVFLRMVRGLPGYRLTGAPFLAWLYRIAANRVADFYRGRESITLEPIPEHYGSEVDLADHLVD